MNKNVTIKLLGKEFVVGCPADKEQELQASANHLNEKMQEIKASGKVISMERIAVMAALNLSNEYLSSQKEQRDKMEDTMLRLSEKIDRSLSNEQTNQ